MLGKIRSELITVLVWTNSIGDAAKGVVSLITLVELVKATARKLFQKYKSKEVM